MALAFFQHWISNLLSHLSLLCKQLLFHKKWNMESLLVLNPFIPISYIIEWLAHLFFWLGARLLVSHVLGQWFSWGASLLTYLLLTPCFPSRCILIWEVPWGPSQRFSSFFRPQLHRASFSLCWLCEPLLESRVMSKLSLGAFPFVVESESGVRVLWV